MQSKRNVFQQVCALLLLGWMGLSPVGAQGFIKQMMKNLYGGPKIEANTSHFIANDLAYGSTLKIGGAAGGFLGLKLSDHLAVQEDIMVYYRTAQLRLGNAPKGDFKNVGMELAFYAMGKWNLGQGKILLGAGPFVNYGISAELKAGGEKTNLYEETTESGFGFKRMNAGAAVIAGYEWKCGVQVSLSYKLGLLNTLDAPHSDAALRPGYISCGVAYRFGR